MSPSTLWGVPEIAAAFGVRRETVYEWRKADGFPEPRQQLAMGPVWDASKVRTWALRNDREEVAA